MTLGLVCVAGGGGRRFGGDKLAEELGGESVLERSLRALRAACPEAPLVAVLPAEMCDRWRPKIARIATEAKCVPGGTRRQDSVRNGVQALRREAPELVVIHDGARPLVAPADIRRAVGGIGSADGCILCQAVADTVKRVDDEGGVTETVPRADLRLAQTPQVFRRLALQHAWETVDFDREWTDEAALLESMGLRVNTVLAEYPNPKLTTVADLAVMRALVEVAER